MTSTAFVQWAKGQIEKYAEMFRKQVYSLDVDPEIINVAIKVTKAQSKKVCKPLSLANLLSYRCCSY